MDRGSDALAYRRLRAPRESGSALVDPPSDQFSASLAANRSLLAANARREFGGVRLGTLQQSARKHLVEAAASYMSSYASLSESAAQLLARGESGAPLLLTGHQPQLFHPGVWFKNFVLDQRARVSSAIAINLIIDNDTVRTAAIRVPTGTVAAPHVVTVPLDQAGEEVPFEERPILDRELFATFADRVLAMVKSLVPNPLVSSLWPLAVAAMQRTDQLGLCLSQARHLWEQRWGLRLLDVPLSAVCDAEPFRRFLLELVAQAARFREVYNGSLGEYRRSHRIRSRSHPVPELAIDGEWIELPFWIWTTQAPRRRRLFVRRTPEAYELTDRGDWRLALDARDSGVSELALNQLVEARKAGVKIRPRALATTLFSRLVLGDHFVHGIGGAKYDQLTDALFVRFLGMEPPSFVTATATVSLPINHPRTTMDEVREWTHRIRELDFHPEVSLDDRQRADPYVASLVEEKRRWISLELPRGHRLSRHRAIGAINETLLTMVEQHRASWREEWERTRASAQRHSLLASREFSYCLFPANELRDGLLALSAPAS